MQVGMNSNITHQGRTLHVQTEDSGHEHGHIITHLFLSGGIIATQRFEYDRQLVDQEIQEAIKDQHQEMIKSIQRGDYNKKILLARPKRAQRGAIPLARKKRESSPVVADPTPHPSNAREGHEPEKISRGPWALPRVNPINPKRSRVEIEKDGDETSS